MAVLLFKFMFFTLSSLMNLASALIFNTVARLIVLVIHGLRIPTQGISGMFSQGADMVKSITEYFMELLMGAISTIISTAFDSFKEIITGSAALTSSAVGELMGKTRDSLDQFLENFKQVFESMSEMIWRIVGDLWTNYKSALGYVSENL